MNAVGRRAGAAALVALGLSLLPGCGDGDEEKARAAASAAASASAASASSASASAAALAAEQEAYDACEQAVDSLMEQMQEIGSRLSIGMSYAEYTDYLSDARVTYDRSFTQQAIAAMDRDCLGEVAVPLENAFKAYVNVHTLWGDCIEDYGCDFSEGQTNDKAQGTWVRAGKQTEKAADALAEMEPTSS